MSYTIYLDTANRYKKIVNLLKEGTVVDTVKTSKDELSAVVKILQKNNLDFEDIEKININKGPGSFTGLKIGASIANTFNYLKGNLKSWGDLIIPNYGGEPNISTPASSRPIKTLASRHHP